jgi:hypothetical protein
MNGFDVVQFVTFLIALLTFLLTWLENGFFL